MAMFGVNHKHLATAPLPKACIPSCFIIFCIQSITPVYFFVFPCVCKRVLTRSNGAVIVAAIAPAALAQTV